MLLFVAACIYGSRQVCVLGSNGICLRKAVFPSALQLSWRHTPHCAFMQPPKLNKILALTQSPNENESDTACRMLCRALTSMGYIFSETEDSPEPVAYCDYDWPDPPQKPARNFRKITNKYETYCKCCKAFIPAGERVLWIPGEGVIHIECKDVFY